MPAIRAQYLNHPQTGIEGFWVELTSDPPGTLKGIAKSQWITRNGNETLETYTSRFNTILRTAVGNTILVTATFSTFGTLDFERSIEVKEVR